MSLISSFIPHRSPFSERSAHGFNSSFKFHPSSLKDPSPLAPFLPTTSTQQLLHRRKKAQKTQKKATQKNCLARRSLGSQRCSSFARIGFLFTMEGMKTHGVLARDLKVPYECERPSHVAVAAEFAPAAVFNLFSGGLPAILQNRVVFHECPWQPAFCCVVSR